MDFRNAINLLTLYGTENRLLIYSIADGKRLGQIFGASGAFSPMPQILVAENEPGILTVYSLPFMEKRMQLTFSDPVSFIQFSKDGKRLFVLTAGQLPYLFDTQALMTQPATAAGESLLRRKPAPLIPEEAVAAEFH